MDNTKGGFEQTLDLYVELLQKIETILTRRTTLSYILVGLIFTLGYSVYLNYRYYEYIKHINSDDNE